jgi:hypothetical protein
MLYSRLGGRRERRGPELPPEPQATPAPQEQPHEGSASPEELNRARSELADELARRAARSER